MKCIEIYLGPHYRDKNFLFYHDILRDLLNQINTNYAEIVPLNDYSDYFIKRVEKPDEAIKIINKVNGFCAKLVNW